MKIFMISILTTLLALGISEASFDTYSIFKQILLSNINSETMGTITSSESIIVGLGTKAPHKGYDIRYKYSIKGRDYKGSLVN